VRAYHFGPQFLVEIELVMAEDTLLKHSHDVGILLQHKIESLEECERCFVHIDYAHRDGDDHDPEVPVHKKIASTLIGEGEDEAPPSQSTRRLQTARAIGALSVEDVDFPRV